MTKAPEQKCSLIKTRNPFSQIPNELIASPNISGKAKAVYCYFISKPDNWTFYLGDMVCNMKEGEDAIRSAISELVKTGWIDREQLKVDGKYSGSRITVRLSSSVTSLPQGENQHAENQHAEKPGYNNTDPSNTDLKKKNIKKKKSEYLGLNEWEAIHGRLNYLQHICPWAREKGLDERKVEYEVDRFRDKCLQKGYKYADFVAAFRNSLRDGWYGRAFNYYQDGTRQPELLPAASVVAHRQMNPTDL